MSWWANLLGAGGRGVGSDLVRLAAELVPDTDQRAALIADLVKTQLQLDAAPPWVAALPHWQTLSAPARAALVVVMLVDAAHRLARVALWAWVVYVGARAGLPLDQLALLAAGPALYTALKGRGRA